MEFKYVDGKKLLVDLNTVISIASTYMSNDDLELFKDDLFKELKRDDVVDEINHKT